MKEMEQKKKLTLLWRKLNSLEFGKDVVLVPYYLGQALDYEVEICCGYSEETAAQIALNPKEGLKFIQTNLGYNPYQRIPVYIKYLLQNARHIDLLMCFHWKLETFINILLYKFLNKRGRVYIKLDTEQGNEWDLSRRSFISRMIRKKLYTNLLNKVDILSCETSKGYDNLCHNTDLGGLLKKKLVMMPNAFDEMYLKTLNISEFSFQQKENLMITVGRLGTHQKNTEMLLEALKNINLKEWRFVLIGPVEENFKKAIKQFYKEHPEKGKQVTFVGKIENKKELWEWYNKAKVFVCTSRWESYGIVLDEAKYFKNYIVSTNVGAAQDVIEQEKYGSFVEQGSSTSLNRILSQIINGEIDVDIYQDYNSHQLSYYKKINTLLKFLAPCSPL